jgi:hypothetical protein
MRESVKYFSFYDFTLLLTILASYFGGGEKKAAAVDLMFPTVD